MIPAISASKIYSTLGNSNSLVPLALKDVTNSLGLTAASYTVGDEAEGRDRFIDEFGTQAIWLFGIPTYKKLIDLTLFKAMGYDPKIDVRVLKDPAIFAKAKQYAPTNEIKNALEKVGKSSNNIKTFKGLSFGKFLVSTGLTILSYYGLTKFRHKHTEEHIKENYLKKLREQGLIQNNVNTEKFLPTQKVPTAFGIVHKQSAINENGKNKDRNTTFTGIQDFMFSPTKNLMIVDATITAERLFESRNAQDTLGYAIKEGSFWAFMYILGGKIQKHFENNAEKNHNKNIQLDARVIESKDLKLALKNKELPSILKAFSNIKKDADVYDFVCNPANKDNIIVKMAKMSDIITVTNKKDLTSAVDTRAYIDIAEVKGINEKLGKVFKQFGDFKTSMLAKNPKMSDEDILNTFMKDLKKLKRSSILKNIGSCIAALGIIAPTLMVAIRFIGGKDNRDFQVKKEIEKKLAEEIKNGNQVS